MFHRFRISKSAWLPPFEKNWLFAWGGDEYGNTVLSVRISPSRYFEAIVNWPIRRHRLPHGVTRDLEAGALYVEYGYDDFPGCVARSERLGRSLVVHYNAAGEVHSVDLLRLDALSDPCEVKALRTVLPDYVVDETVDLVGDWDA